MSVLKLSDKQAIFAVNLGKLLLFSTTIPGIRLRLGEGYVGDSIDKPYEDTPHIRRGTHFLRLGQDLILDRWRGFPQRWVYVEGGDPAWGELGAFWKTLHSQNAWGGDFRGRAAGDFGHFSMTHGGVK